MKTWTMKKKKEAVSPVIATILMVAITVVLAAVLYVMVMGFGGDTNSTPTASLTADDNHLVLSISDDFAPADGVILVSMNNSAPVAIGAFSSGQIVLGTGTSAVTLVDAGGDGLISQGDYFITGTGSGNVAISVLYKSGNTNTPIASGTVQ